MTPQISTKQRRRAAQFYLSIAKRLPERFAIVHRILRMEKAAARHPAQLSLQDLAQARASYDLLGTAFVEMFLVEQARQVKENIRALFPRLAQRREFGREITDYGRQLDEQSYVNIGRLQRYKRYPELRSGDVRTLPMLPNEVDYVEISLSQDMPSVLFLNFEIGFNSSATDAVMAILEKKFLSPIELRDLRPWNIDRGYSVCSAEIERQRVIAEYLNGLAAKTQTVLWRGLRGGYFSSEQPSRQLPGVHVFSLRGTIHDDDPSHVTWQRESLAWRAAADLDLERGHYDAPDFVLLPDMGDWYGYPSSWRIALKPERYYEEMYGQDERTALFEKLIQELPGFLALIGLMRFQEIQEQTLGRFRVLAYRAFLSHIRFPIIGPYAKLYERMLSMRMFVQRLRSELRTRRSDLTAETLLGRIAAFQYGAGDASKAEGEPRGALVNSVLERFDLIWGNLEAARTFIADLLTVRNISATFRLTALLLIATIAALLGWSTVQSWIASLFHTVSAHLRN